MWRTVSGSASEVTGVPTCQFTSCPVFLVVTSISGSLVDIGSLVLWGTRGEGFQKVTGKQTQRPLHKCHYVSLGGSLDRELLALLQRFSNDQGSQLQVTCPSIHGHRVAVIILWSVALNQADFNCLMYFVDIDSSYTVMAS